MSEQNTTITNFDEFGLSAPVLRGLDSVGYETPTPIQALTISHVLAGRDVIGQAQTGTGKTAAFALPLLSRLDLRQKEPQVLVLAPTRELAIQVAEAFQQYAKYLKNFHVLPIYGGQAYSGQLRQLKRGVHVVVGTPGRVMDHMRRGTLNLQNLSCLVLDEADEMLRMGFIDDVEWILEQTPDQHQTALFSATMPAAIRRIAQRYLKNPKEVSIKMHTTAADTIQQRFWKVGGYRKLDALTRILEAEPFDGMLVFVRTKTATMELAEKLEARGFSVAPLNGDIAQRQRERTVERFRAGKLDILVATDVAARGLDVDRISHVINYDIPYDTESYVHRIGRTGRAGRNGQAIMFVEPRESHLLRTIERTLKQKIERMELPSTEMINNKRIVRFKQRITDALADGEDLTLFRELISQYEQEHNVPALDIAAALAKLVQGNEPLLLKNKPMQERPAYEPPTRRSKKVPKNGSQNFGFRREPGMETYRIEVGHLHGAKPGNIVGAIANESGISSEHIGRIRIFDEYSTVDLPEEMPMEILRDLKRVWVAGQQLNIARLEESFAPRKSKKRLKAKSSRRK